MAGNWPFGCQRAIKEMFDGQRHIFQPIKARGQFHSKFGLNRRYYLSSGTWWAAVDYDQGFGPDSSRGPFDTFIHWECRSAGRIARWKVEPRDCEFEKVNGWTIFVYSSVLHGSLSHSLRGSFSLLLFKEKRMKLKRSLLSRPCHTVSLIAPIQN